jgi:uncharacterized protein YdhG (YjbR/CyaY superfamily)
VAAPRNLQADQAVGDFLARVPEPQRSALLALREQIRTAAPDAVEGLSYGMPAFRVRGKPLAGYAATKDHCSYHPMSGSVVETLGTQLDGYETSKGTIHFRPDAPLSDELVALLVATRRREIEGPING